MDIKTLFATNNEASTTNARSLRGTAELTALANSCMKHIMEAMNAESEAYTERIQASIVDSAELNKLIDELIPEYSDEAAFLLELEDETVDGILKSQQSKRSRAKSKPMTLDNYTTLMTAAVAEHILRHTIERLNSTAAVRSGSLDYTVEQLEKFNEDQEALRKEIRNVQSKKSIMKSRADFSEEDDRWVTLCKVEQQLKDMRVTVARPKVVRVDETKQAMQAMLAEVDIAKLKSAEAHELLARLADLAAPATEE